MKTADPFPNVKRPSLALDIVVAPDILVVGETATVSITVTNLSDTPADALTLTVPVPDKVVTHSGPLVNGKQPIWRWDLGHLASQAQTTVTATFKVTGALKGDAVLFNAEASARDMPAAAAWSGGALVAEKRQKQVIQAFKRGQKTLLQSDDGRVTVDLPADVDPSDLTLTYIPPDDILDPTALVGSLAPATTRAAKRAVPAGHRGFGAFTLTATDLVGTGVHQFAKPVKLTLRYTPEQLAALGLHEATLGLFWFDDTQQQWVAVPSTVDASAQTITAEVDHFSTWQLGDQRTPSDAYVPSLQGFQASLFTGAATYRIPIEVPAGPGGLQPDLNLSYSSAATDGPGGERRNSQAGWVGKGWTLDAGGYIARNISTVGDPWDYFSLVFGGRSFDVVRGEPTGVNSNGRTCTDYSDANKQWVPCWKWHAVDENFVKVRAVAVGSTDYTWQAWTPDGTRYTFAKYVRTYDTRGVYVYKWMLTEVQDTHGNRMTYEYAGPTYNCAGWTCEPIPTLWRIRWAFDTSGNPRYQIVLGLADRTSGYTAGVDTQWDYQLQGQSTQYRDFAPRELYRVDSISVQSWRDGATNYELVRQYGLRYADAATSVATDDYPASGQKQLTLLYVQQIGKDGSSALPATTFTYGMDAGSGNPRPAGYNRLKTVDNGYGGRITFTYDHPWTQASDPTRWPYLRNYHRLTSSLTQDVSGQTYSTSTFTRYDYTASAVNDASNSATWWYARYPSNNQDNRDLLAHPENWEFRGHSTVTVTTYDGSTVDTSRVLRMTRHWFYQGNANCQPTLTNTVVNENDSCFQEMRRQEGWKGREYQTDTFASNGVLLERTATSYTRTELPFYGTDSAQSGNYKRAGLWRAFNSMQQTTVSAYDGGGTPQNHTTIYGYDINTGNTTRIEERNESGATVRVTNRYYLTRNGETDSTYMVDRMWGENVYDGAGNLLALTHRFFDNTANPQAQPTTGDLLLERRYFDTTQLLGADTRYGYDQWGNRTTVMTYAGAGRYNGSANTPGNGSTARTTTTDYDPAFHVFPVKVTNPLGHVETANYDYRMGTVTSVTDPNNATTSGEYDVFGRISKLIKPGDSSASPTTSFAYFDTARPVQYIVSPKDQTGAMQLQYSYDGLGRQIQTKRESVDGAQNIVTDTSYDGLGRQVAQSQPRYVNETPSTTFWSYSPTGGSLYRPTTTSYDALDRPLLTSMPDGTTTEHHYGIVNDNGTLLRYDDLIDANRHRTQTRTDALGRRVQVLELTGDCGTWQYGCGGAYTTGWATSTTTRYSYDALDQLKQVQDAFGNSTSMQYDSTGRKTSMSDPDMGTWYYSYDANGNLLNQIDAKGQATTFGYDALDRLTSRIGVDPTVSGFTDTFESKSSNWIWGANQTVPYNEGGYNRLKSTGTGVDWSANAGRAAYSLSDGSGVWLRFKVDSTNTEAHFMLEANDSVYKRLGVVANNGNLELEHTTDGANWTYPGNLITNLKTNTWYDLQMTIDDVGGFSVVAYEEGNPTNRGVYRVQMPAGKTWRIAHAIYRNTAIVDDYREFPGAAYRYDAGGDANGIGRRTSMVNHAAVTMWKYDARGRVTEATDYMAWMNQTRTFAWAYDSADHITAIGYPTGEVTSYQYDAAGRPRQLCTNVWSGCYVTNATYTALDQPQQWSFGNGLVQNWDYDAPMQRLWLLRLGTGSNPEQYLKQSYNYDTASNIKRIDDYMANANYNFSYDHRDRLTRAWTTSNGLTTADEGYAYDAIGNLTQKGSIASQYGSNLNGTGVGPHQVRQVGGQSVSYDANGNMLAGNSRTFTWNTQNQPTTITGLDGVTEVYNYNADGERVTRTRGNDTTVFFEGLWEEVLSSSNRYYYPFNGQMVAMRDNTIGGAVFWLHGDLLGSVTASSDGNGNVTRQVFGPWGQLRAGSSSISQTTLNYTGQRLDGTGLLYYHARYYDPALGRFISPDSVVPDYKDPQDLNRYSYVKNNPVRYNDPTGHCGKTTFAETAASVMTFDCTCRAWDALQKVKTPQDKALMATVTVLSAGGATAGWVGGTILGMQGAAALTGAVAMSAEASAATTGAVQLASANAVAGASGSTAAQLASGQDVDPTSVGVAALTSAATGGVAGYTRLASTPLGTTLLNGAAGAAQYQLDTALHGKQATTTDTLISAGIGAFGGAVGGPVTPRRFNVFPSVTAASRAFARSNFTKGTFTRTALTGIGTNYNWADLIYSGRGPR